MSRPFFSVLIPTKLTRDRRPLVENAVLSVLKQSFSDFEVIVADDSDAEFAPQVERAIAELGDARVRYVRGTGSLSMADNWEHGSRQATGEYLTVLADRAVYRPSSLHIVHDVLEESRARLVSWYLDSFARDPEEQTYVRHPSSGRARWFGSDAIFGLLTTGNVRIWSRYLPRVMNSCAHRSVIESVRATTGGRGFLPVNPDYTGGLLQLAHTGELLHLDLPLYIPCGKGNGFSLRRGTDIGKRFMSDVQIGPGDLYETVPIKADLVHNLIMRDFMEVRRNCSRQIGHHTFSPVVYYQENLRDVALRRAAGAEWRAYLDEVLRALSQEPRPVIRRVEASDEYAAVMANHRSGPRLVKKYASPAYLHRRLRASLRYRFLARPLEAEKFEIPSRMVWDAIREDEARPRSFGIPGTMTTRRSATLASVERHWPWKSSQFTRRVVYQ